jgi:hypothetical protein
LTSTVPLLLGRELTTNTTMSVGPTPANGAAITADHCVIGSNASVAVNTTKTVNYDLSTAPSQCIRPASIQLPAATA